MRYRSLVAKCDHARSSSRKVRSARARTPPAVLAPAGRTSSSRRATPVSVFCVAGVNTHALSFDARQWPRCACVFGWGWNFSSNVGGVALETSVMQPQDFVRFVCVLPLRWRRAEGRHACGLSCQRRVWKTRSLERDCELLERG
jgi:hypothetical protein